MLTQILFITIFFSIFVQTYSLEQCKNHRVCPNNHICSSNGVHCMENGQAKMRTSWSLLTNQCIDDKTKSCAENSLCLKGSVKCVYRDIIVCDSYLKMMTLSGCEDYKFLSESFEFCSDFYLNQYTKVSTDSANVMKCADMELRVIFSNTIHKYKPLCYLLEQYAVGNFTKEYVECGMCFESSTWPSIFGLIRKWGNFSPRVENDFAKRCNQQYLNKKKEWKVEEIKRHAKLFIDKTFELTGYDMTRFFKDSLELKNDSLILSTTQSSNSSIFQHKHYSWISLLIFVSLLLFALLFVLLWKKSFKKPKNEYFCAMLPQQLPPPLPQQITSENEYESGASQNSAEYHVRFFSRPKN